jgi:hypothetical protein
VPTRLRERKKEPRVTPPPRKNKRILGKKRYRNRFAKRV